MITTSGRVSFITATASSRSGASTATTPPASSTAARSIARDEASDSRIATRQRGGPFWNILRIDRMSTSLSGALAATRVPGRTGGDRPGKESPRRVPEIPSPLARRCSDGYSHRRTTDSHRDRGGTSLASPSEHAAPIEEARSRATRSRTSRCPSRPTSSPARMSSPRTESRSSEEDAGRTRTAGLRLLAAVPGPLIAAATFVPTFLAIFFGLSYVVGGVLQTGSTASAPRSPAALMSDPGPGTPPPISEVASRSVRSVAAPRVLDSPSGRAG